MTLAELGEVIAEFLKSKRLPKAVVMTHAQYEDLLKLTFSLENNDLMPKRYAGL